MLCHGATPQLKLPTISNHKSKQEVCSDNKIHILCKIQSKREVVLNYWQPWTHQILLPGLQSEPSLGKNSFDIFYLERILLIYFTCLFVFLLVFAPFLKFKTVYLASFYLKQKIINKNINYHLEHSCHVTLFG